MARETERQQEPKIVDIPACMQARLARAHGIPKSLDVDALIRRVPFDVAGVAIANCSSLWQDSSMAIEAFLERVPDADISILQCSICKEQFHTSPVGPRKP